MVRLHRLGGPEVVVNADLVVTAESTPETLLVFTNGDRIKVREGLEELMDLVLEEKRRVRTMTLITGARDGG